MILVTGRWISIKANTAFLTFVFSWSLLVSAADLKVMMLKDGSSPYAENAGGDVLSTFNRAVLGQLILSTSSYELEAGLLKSWKWNKKDGSYDLFLREGLTFHDGSPVKSDDLEFALLRGFFTKNRSFYQIYLGNILGVDSIKPGTPFSTGLISGVTITGSHSINIKLKNPNPSFLYSLTRPFFSFCKRSALNEDLMTWKKWPTGAGDYKIESEDDDKIILSKRFTSSKPSSNKIILYKKIKSDVQFDISFFPLDQKMDLFKTENPSAIFTLFFTNQNELSKNVNFRKAIKYGVNRKELVDGDILLRPAYEFLSSSFWKNDNSIIVQTDLNKAKEYFSKVPDALKAKTWRIPVFSFGQLSESKKKITSNLKKQFLTFGFKVDFYPSTEKFLAKETAMESPMAFTGRICNNVDPLLMFSSFQTDSAYKYDNAQNDKAYDSLFSAAQKAITTEERIETLRKLSKYSIDQDFMVPLYEDVQYYYYNAATVSSFGNQTNAITLFLDEIVTK